jgi:hypothetical protein
MSLKEARIRALKERVRVADGVDVVADKRRTRIALASAKTIAAEDRAAADRVGESTVELSKPYIFHTVVSVKPPGR